MNSIHTEKELKEFISKTLNRELTEQEQINFSVAMEWLNDPRRGYNIIDTVESVLYWLKDGRYNITRFEGGAGLSMVNGGGCSGFFADGLLEQMNKDDLITYNPSTCRFGGIRPNGYAILGRMRLL